MKDFGFVATVFLPQRRSPGIVGRKLNGNGIVLRAKYFLPGVGICTKIICNLKGREIVEKHLGQRLTWAIQHPDNVEMSAPPSNPANKANAAELLPPAAKDVDVDAWQLGVQIP